MPPESRRWVPSRRELLAGGLGALGAAALGPLASVLHGCRSARVAAGSRAADAAEARAAEAGERPEAFPLLEASGDAYAVGLAVGRRFAREIREGIARRREWLDDLLRFAENDGRASFERMIDAARRCTPGALEEARGLAAGARVPEREILALNCRSELEAAQRSPGAGAGCSTIAVVDDRRLLLAHNEDGDLAYADLMYLVRVRPPGGVSFVALCYPGIVAGNAPALNDRGVAMITNYIGTVAWRAGVPRYFLDRVALEATSIDDAVRRTLHPERAYSFHHVIAAPEGGRPRAVALEATPTRERVEELSGVYLHTNHLVLDGMTEEAEVEEYIAKSSQPRYDALRRALAEAGDPAGIDQDDLALFLSSHEGRPYSPCRHPEGEIRGATLACAVFDVPRGRMRLYRGNPCRGTWAEYTATG